MNILYLFSTNVETVNDRLMLGLTKVGYSLGSNLFYYPFKENHHSSKDHFTSLGLPFSGLLTVGEMVKRLQTGFFDVVFIANIWTFGHLHSVYAYILDAVGDIPCVIISQDGRPIEEAWTFRQLNVVAQFCAEKKLDWNVYPISYSEMEGRMPLCVPRATKRFDTFFAGRSSAERKQYVEALRGAGYQLVSNCFYDMGYSKYIRQLRHSRVTFMIPAGFYNCNRLIEGPAQGVCLLSYDYRKIIEVREDYTDDVNAVFFSTPEEMLMKLAAILDDEERQYEITDAGFSHIKEHHLVQHCARYVLDIVEEVL